MSKSAVVLLSVLFLALTISLDKHYYAALDQQYKFTVWVLTAFCRGMIK